MKNGTDIAEATGITFSVNDGEAVDVTNGEAVGQFRLAPITACGVVGEDGILTVKFNVAAENNISWLSFKNVKYELQRTVISSTTGTFAQVENAKLSNKWEANEGPAFTLESPFNFMTAANLAGGAWTSVDGILEDPYIGFYSNDADAYFSVVAPDGIQITSLVIEASALKGSPVLNDVEIPAFGETVTIPYDNVQVATFYLGGDAAWMAATITVNYTGSTASQAPIATGVNTVKSVTAPAAVFNLAGQRVNKAQKGIYIVNGKKVVK